MVPQRASRTTDQGTQDFYCNRVGAAAATRPKTSGHYCILILCRRRKLSRTIEQLKKKAARESLRAPLFAGDY
jgi:hypothetical protein